MVERNTPGILTGKVEDKMGMRGSRTVEVIFENVIVPAQNRVSEKNQGFFMALDAFASISKCFESEVAMKDFGRV